MGWQRFGRSVETEEENDMATPYGLGSYGGMHFDSRLNQPATGQYLEAKVETDYYGDKTAYAMGMDYDTYNRVVVMPSTFLSIVFALLACSMYSRYKQGKPVTPWCGCGYTGVPSQHVSGAPASAGAAGSYVSSAPPASTGPSGSYVSGGPGSAPPGSMPPGSMHSASAAPGSMPPGSMAPGSMHSASMHSGSVPPGSAPGASAVSGGPSAAGSLRPASGPGSVVAAAPAAEGEKKERKELPYERIPTPGVTPYTWSPPASIFQPSPTPPGTPFEGGSPAAAAAADESPDQGEDGE